MPGISQQLAIGEPKLAAADAASAAEEQFAALVARQSRFVFRVAYSVLRNAHDAEDVAQETFLKIYRTHRWQAIDDERAFLARAAWRLAIDRSRRAAAAATRFEPRCGRPTPEEELIRMGQEAMVQRLIDALPDSLRLPLALSTVEEMRSQEIAEVMGIPEATVRSRIARARKVLKERLAALMESKYGR